MNHYQHLRGKLQSAGRLVAMWRAGYLRLTRDNNALTRQVADLMRQLRRHREVLAEFERAAQAEVNQVVAERDEVRRVGEAAVAQLTIERDECAASAEDLRMEIAGLRKRVEELRLGIEVSDILQGL